MNLIEEVRRTKTLSGGVPVYKKAEIKINPIHPEDVKPTALYVLLPGIRWLIQKSDYLANRGVDIFNLTEIYHDEEITIGPPLVEWSDETWAIVDGIHRFWLARKENICQRAILVKGVTSELPLVGLPVEWSDVSTYEIKPEQASLLKRLRPGIEDRSEVLRKHYRDLSYLGSRGRRPRTGQNG